MIYGGLAIGVAGVSLSAIFIRLAGEAPAMTIASYRMGISAIVILIPTLTVFRSQVRTIRSEDIKWLFLAGLFLAGHFASWITSLELTSVANSVLLGTTASVFVAIGSHWGLREKVSLPILSAIGLSAIGGLILAAGQDNDDGQLLGDALALIGSACAAGYLLIGRRVRSHIHLFPYVAFVYTASALLLLLGTIALGEPLTGFSPKTYIWIILVAFISQVIGHSMLNWVLARLSAITVTLVVRAEPIIATLLAILILDEVPSWLVIPGGLLILVAVGLAVPSQFKLRVPYKDYNAD